MIPVQVGQTWQTLSNAQTAISVVVEAIEGSEVRVVTVRGRRFKIPMRHFRVGQRGCRLLVHADGKPVAPRPRLILPPVTLAEKSTASDRVKVHAPRGLAKVSDLDRETLKLFAEGKTVQEIADHYGASKHTVQARLNRAKDAWQDERNAAAMRASR